MCEVVHHSHVDEECESAVNVIGCRGRVVPYLEQLALVGGVGVAERKIVGVGHHHVGLRVEERDAVLGLPAGGDGVLGHGAVQGRAGISALGGHRLEVVGIGEVGIAIVVSY